jgi:protein unc-13
MSLFPASLEPQIKQSVEELGSLLAKVKGQGQVSLPSQRNNIAQESDAIMEPLLNLLDEG